MRLRRVRTYLLGPGVSKRRVYTYRASRTIKKEYPHIPGQRIRRTHWVRYEGYGQTPKQAQIDLRKTRKRREPRAITTKEDLALNRHLARKWERDNTVSLAMRRTLMDWLVRKSKEENRA